jgi:peptidoglycan/LPS O-acetylase OafA/YrhL
LSSLVSRENAGIAEQVHLPPQAKPRTEHFDFIDGIRALCALFVLLGHAWFQPTAGFYSQRWMNLLGLSYAHLAVVVFIVVSGFVITLPIVRRGDMGPILGFFKRRARRILPPYYAALLLTSAFILLTGQHKTGTVWDFSVPLTWPQFIGHSLLVHNLPLGLEGGGIGYQLWSIAVEWQIYLLVPLLVLGISRFGFVALVCLLTLISAGVVVFLPQLHDTYAYFVVLFMSGAGAARLVVLRPRDTERAGLIGLGIALAALALVLKNGNAWYARHLALVDLLLGAGVGPLIAGLALAQGKLLTTLKRILRWRPLVFVGSFSYSLYLVHTPLLHGAWLIWSKLTQQGPVGLFGLLLLSCPLIVVLSWCFFVLFERPFMRSAVAPSTR